MILLCGIGAIVLGVFCMIGAVSAYGSDGPIFGILVLLFFVLFFGGIVTALIGFGYLMATPHDIHIGG